MKASLVSLMCLFLTFACSSTNCDDIACSSRLELSLTFETDGEWSLDLGSHGSCDVKVVSRRVDSSNCAGGVTLSSTVDADVLFINANPRTLTLAYSGVEEGSTSITPSYEDQKSGCDKSCMVAQEHVSVGAS